MKLCSLLFFAVLSLTSCSSVPHKYAGDPNVLHLIVLHTNDVHGHAWPRLKSDSKTWGGFAAQSILVAKIRDEAKKDKAEVILLSAGDVNTGVPESDLQAAEPDFFAMNEIGYDAMVLGNHEFDRGTDQILKQAKWAKFPLLSSNIHFKGKNKTQLAAPTTLLVKNGFKIGILGLTTDSLRSLVIPKNTAHLDIEPVLTAAKREVAELKKHKADILVALTHIGVSKGNGTHKRKIGTLDEDLADAEPDISLIVGGHSHTLLNEGIKTKTALIVQAGEKGENLGRVDIYWDRVNHKVLEASATVLPITSDLGENAGLAKKMDEFKSKVGTELEKEIGKTKVNLDGERSRVRYLESNLGNLITDVLRDFTHTDISVYNGGGIRASIPAGPIKLRDIYLVFPFNNTIQSAELTGKQLKVLFQQGLTNLETIGSLLHVSGASYTIKDKKIFQIKIAGKPLQENKTYTLSTNSFVMTGGDSFSVLLDAKNIKETGVTVDQALIEYIHKHPVLDPKVEGRIRVEK